MLVVFFVFGNSLVFGNLLHWIAFSACTKIKVFVLSIFLSTSEETVHLYKMQSGFRVLVCYNEYFGWLFISTYIFIFKIMSYKICYIWKPNFRFLCLKLLLDCFKTANIKFLRRVHSELHTHSISFMLNLYMGGKVSKFIPRKCDRNPR